MTQTAIQADGVLQEQAANVTEETSAQKGALGAYDTQQQFALKRYARFSMLRRQMLPELEAEDWRTRLIHKALFAAYLDCTTHGVGEEARLFGTREVAAAA